MIVEIEKLVKRYGDLVALDHFNLQIKEGEVFGLLGPNGSGKTTAINCMLSLLKFDKGSIKLFGKKMSPTAYDIKKDIGIVMQNVAVFDELTVYENIYYFCGLYIRNKARLIECVNEVVEFTGLKDFLMFYPKKLSGGLLRRLNIACGIAHKPKLIIMDEPTVAVDPQSRNNILEGIQKLNREGATVLYTSHYMDEVEQICTNIAIMDKGKVIAAGTKEELKEMIGIEEKITIEIIGESDGLADEIKTIQGVHRAEMTDALLFVQSAKGKHILANILYYLQEKNISAGSIYSEKPTLNDVFLEITGKELRDHV